MTTVAFLVLTVIALFLQVLAVGMCGGGHGWYLPLWLFGGPLWLGACFFGFVLYPVYFAVLRHYKKKGRGNIALFTLLTSHYSAAGFWVLNFEDRYHEWIAGSYEALCFFNVFYLLNVLAIAYVLQDRWRLSLMSCTVLMLFCSLLIGLNVYLLQLSGT